MVKQLILICGLILAMGGAATAASNEVEARKAFKLGTALYREDRFSEAADEFRKAYRLRPAWKILFNIGQCSAAAKQYGLALEAFESYLSQGGDDIPHDKQLEIVEEMRILKAMVGYVSVDAPDGVEVTVDGNVRGTTPLPGPIPVGTGVNHEIVLENNGALLVRKVIRVGSGKTLNVNVASEKEGAPAADVAPVDEDNSSSEADASGTDDKKIIHSRPFRIAGWATTGVGVVSLGMMAFTGAKAISSSDEGNSDKARNFQISSNVLLGVGSTLTVAGAAMVIVSYVSAKRQRKKENQESLSVLPAISPEGFSLSLSRRF